ncbi:MAG: hypothetical protein JJT75_03625 [Opitutales bacterium]|nr:hypothetical protein [Opitutales bacterium]MCH8540266.1 hypothetical protein [Opitutales bacterium]
MSPSAKIERSTHWGGTQLWDFLFSDLAEPDPFFWQQIEEGVRKALADHQRDQEPSTKTFLDALLELRKKWELPPVGVAYLNLRKGFHYADPLFLRSEVVHLMKGIASYARAAVVVEGLRLSAKGPYRYWSRGAQIRYAETLALLRAVICRYSRKSAEVHLILLEPRGEKGKP